MYELNIDKNKFYQGDIVNDFPFFVFTTQLNLLEKKDDSIFEYSRIDDFPEHPKEFIVAFPIRLHRVIILTQTCDVQNNSNVVVAPVYSLSEINDDGRLIGSNIGLVRKRRGAMKDWFYLPALDGVFDESFVDFQTIHYLPNELLIKYLNKKIVSLSDWGRHLFGWAVSDLFARPIEDKYR